MNDEKLIGYIRGELISETEIVEILNWIEASSENQIKYNQLKNLWVATGLDHPEKIEIPDFSYPKSQRIIRNSSRFASLLKYAAVFILAFSLGSISLYLIKKDQNPELSSLYNSVVVPNGERSQVILYDGTKVWLNSGTKFKYPVVFNHDTREVFIEGEAFFDVAKDKMHPFVVNAEQLKVRVLGTRFNIRAYPEDREFFTTLEEGSINAINSKTGNEIKINPGEQVILNRETDDLKYKNVNTELFTSWKENTLKFDNATFDEVVKKMERWYDIKISVEPNVNTNERYTMTIKTESLREMLALISKTTKINYEIEIDNVIIKKSL